MYCAGGPRLNRLDKAPHDRVYPTAAWDEVLCYKSGIIDQLTDYF